MITGLTALKKYWPVASAIILAGGICKWYYIPSIRLVWRCLSLNTPFPLLNTIRACIDSWWPPKPALFSHQMRHWLEFRLLQPKPGPRPRPKNATRSRSENRPQGAPDEQGDIRPAGDDRGKRPATERENAELEHYRRATRLWASKKDRYAGLIKTREVDPTIELNNVFDLNREQVSQGIVQYLLNVRDLKLTHADRPAFLCKVSIQEGFLLPLSLITGLMSRFRDEWSPLIGEYKNDVQATLSSAQVSLLYIWLLWGPSVSLCKCAQWDGPKALQYGFGDEDNSLPVLVGDDKFRDRIEPAFRLSAANHPAMSFPSIHAKVSGTLRLSSSFEATEFCAAQHAIHEGAPETFVMQYEDHEVIGNGQYGHKYYTAYVWALFVVGYECRPSLDVVNKKPLHHIIPFFEHANIVDGASYDTAKTLVAHKVLTYLRGCASSSRGETKLWYACAIDDPGCGESIAFRPKGDSICECIQKLLDRSCNVDVKNRIDLVDRTYAKVLSSCRLVDLVHGPDANERGPR